VLDRMALVVQVEKEGVDRADALEKELSELRTSAGSKIKQLCTSSKALEDEVARLGEVHGGHLLPRSAANVACALGERDLRQRPFSKLISE
jgi:hypothetical protein